MLRWLRDAALVAISLPLGMLLYLAAIGAILGAGYAVILLIRAVT